jgi:hypothetical protein
MREACAPQNRFRFGLQSGPGSLWFGLANVGPVYGPVWSGLGNVDLLANMQKSPVWPVWSVYRRGEG